MKANRPRRLADSWGHAGAPSSVIRYTTGHLVGVYTDPDHVFAYSDGEVRQEFSVCFACRILGGDITKSDESLEVKFWPVQDLNNLDMHPSIRQRISHYLSGRSEAFIA